MRRYVWLWLSALLALAYIVLIVWAKYAKVWGAPPVKLGEIGEFLLFFSAIAAFTLQVVTAETHAPRRPDEEHGLADRG